MIESLACAREIAQKSRRNSTAKTVASMDNLCFIPPVLASDSVIAMRSSRLLAQLSRRHPRQFYRQISLSAP
jgi:hypothetical protein